MPNVEDDMVGQRINIAWVSLVFAMLTGLADSAGAQQTVEGEFGVGRVLNGEPAIPTVEIGMAGWPSRHWGVGVRLVRGPGEDVENPVFGGDRTFLGAGHLWMWTVTNRYRIGSFELGAGAGFHRYDTIVLSHFIDPDRPDAAPRRSVYVGWDAGLTLEVYKRTLWPHVAIKVGLMYDAWFEAIDYVRPVLLLNVWP
jgi:hypothetical protein